MNDGIFGLFSFSLYVIVTLNSELAFPLCTVLIHITQYEWHCLKCEIHFPKNTGKNTQTKLTTKWNFVYEDLCRFDRRISKSFVGTIKFSAHDSRCRHCSKQGLNGVWTPLISLISHM